MLKTLAISAGALVAAAAPAFAHELPYAHAHPHGIEVVLGAFAIIAAASFVTWRLNGATRRRNRGE